MKQLNCPICGKKTGVKTIETSGKCTNCTNILNLESIELKARSSVLFKDGWKNDYTYDFIKFISKSDMSISWQYKCTNDFRKVLESHDTKVFIEDKLRRNYNEISTSKSQFQLNAIIAYFYSKKSIKFSSKPFTWFPRKLNTVVYYNHDILDYYFDSKRCNDCGAKLKKEYPKGYCNSCMERRSMNSLCQNIEQYNWIENKVINQLFREFMAYLSNNLESNGYINKVARAIIPLFNYLEKENHKIIDDEQIHKFKFINYIDNSWIITKYNEISRHPKKYKPILNRSIIYLLNFFEVKELYSSNEFIELQVINNELKLIDINEIEKEKIKNKITKIPIDFQKLLFHYLDIEELRRKNMKKKNAIKGLKWESIHSNFDVITNFIKDINKKYGVYNWTSITQEIVDSYLLKFNNRKYREINRSKLRSFFRFAKKNGYVIQNPVYNSNYEETLITKKVLSKNEQKYIYNFIIKKIKIEPTASLITSLCYFHALKSSELKNILLKNVHLEEKMIIVSNKRPPVYLDEFEYNMLLNHLQLISNEIQEYNIKHLFFDINFMKISKVSNDWINKQVKLIYDTTPTKLRRAGLQYCSDKFGTQYLHDCMGVSLTHTSRFGNVDEEITEEMLREQLDNSYL